MTTELNKSASQPAYVKLAPGTLIVSATRMPSIDQPWIHDIYIGVTHAPETDPLSWNGRNSEARYCEVTGTIPVSYTFGQQYDRVSDLMPITAEQAMLTGRERVQFFMGAVALWQLERHSHKTREESEAYWKHLEDFALPGTLVVCKNRLPNYPYTSQRKEVQIGIVEAPETADEEASNKIQKIVRVRSGKDLRHEPVGALMPITAEQAALGPREKIEYFLGAVTAWHYDQQMKEASAGFSLEEVWIRNNLKEEHISSPEEVRGHDGQ
jgi:hypothetical protein